MNEEVNAKIATGIMGWELLTVGHFYTREETPRQTELEGWLNQVGIQSIGDYWINVESSFWMESDRWNPATDIAQALQVLGKFSAPVHLVALKRLWDSQWYCEIERNTGFNRIVYREEAETAPMAICLASLKTLERN